MTKSDLPSGTKLTPVGGPTRARPGQVAPVGGGLFFSRDSEAGRTVAGVLTAMRPTSLDIRKRAAEGERGTVVDAGQALAGPGGRRQLWDGVPGTPRPFWVICEGLKPTPALPTLLQAPRRGAASKTQRPRRQTQQQRRFLRCDLLTAT